MVYLHSWNNEEKIRTTENLIILIWQFIDFWVAEKKLRKNGKICVFFWGKIIFNLGVWPFKHIRKMKNKEKWKFPHFLQFSCCKWETNFFFYSPIQFGNVSFQVSSRWRHFNVLLWWPVSGKMNFSLQLYRTNCSFFSINFTWFGIGSNRQPNAKNGNWEEKKLLQTWFPLIFANRMGKMWILCTVKLIYHFKTMSIIN